MPDISHVNIHLFIWVRVRVRVRVRVTAVGKFMHDYARYVAYVVRRIFVEPYD